MDRQRLALEAESEDVRVRVGRRRHLLLRTVHAHAQGRPDELVLQRSVGIDVPARSQGQIDHQVCAPRVARAVSGVDAGVGAHGAPRRILERSGVAVAHQVQRRQQRRESARHLRDPARCARQQGARVPLVIQLIGPSGQLRRQLQGRRSGGRHDPVGEILLPRHQRRVFGGLAHEQTAFAVIGKALPQGVGHLAGPRQPALLPGGVIERNHGLSETGVVLEQSGLCGASVEIDAVDPTRRRSQLAPEQLRRALGSTQIARLAQGIGGLGERGDHHAVPGGEDLLVAMRMRA
uniref:hypothetical protein n=1 Tax=Thiocapsa sp. TaxID=2024551 RepID=UPI003593BD09